MADDADNHLTAIRRTYGRGYVNGLKDAGVTNVEEVMSQKKLRSALDGTHGVERKVYESMPPSQSFRSHEIVTAMARSTHSRPDVAIVEDCLAKLVEKGLATELSKGMWKRVVIRQEIAQPEVMSVTPSQSAEPPKADAADERQTPVQAIRDRLKLIDTHAIQITQWTSEVEDSLKQMEQASATTRPPKELLRELLKSLED